MNAKKIERVIDKIFHDYETESGIDQRKFSSNLWLNFRQYLKEKLREELK